MTDYWIVFSKQLLETFQAGWMHPWKYIIYYEEYGKYFTSNFQNQYCKVCHFYPPTCETEFFFFNILQLNSDSFLKNVRYSLPPFLPQSLAPSCFPISAFVLALSYWVGCLKQNALTRSPQFFLWNRQAWFWPKAGLFGLKESRADWVGLLYGISWIS